MEENLFRFSLPHGSQVIGLSFHDLINLVLDDFISLFPRIFPRGLHDIFPDFPDNTGKF